MTPLMVVLFIQKYFHDFSAPQNLTDFYANIFDIVVNKHNQTKTGFVAQSHSGLNNPMLEAIFTRFCFNAAIKNQSAMARQDFLEVIQNAWHSNSIQYANKSTVDISKIACAFDVVKHGANFWGCVFVMDWLWLGHGDVSCFAWCFKN